MSPNPIFLDNPNDKVVILGRERTVGELKEALIDQAFLKGRLRELLDGGDK